MELWIGAMGPRNWDDFGRTVGESEKMCEQAGIRAGDIVLIYAASGFDLLARFFGAASLGAVVAPLAPDRLVESEAWKAHFRVDWRLDDGGLERMDAGGGTEVSRALLGELRGRGHPGLILATGGTTGSPKLVLHDLASLLATVPVKDGRRLRILPLMHLDHIGGLDAAWRALGGGHILVEPPANLDPWAVAEAVARHKVEVLPATPSFLNLLLIAGPKLTGTLGSLKVVPYGAEPMPPGLLARLREALPGAEFVERFGTSETGALPVRRGGGGLELRGSATGFDWKVFDGELWVRSPARALGYLAGGSGEFGKDGWFRTGDLAETHSDGSIRVLGRREDIINVGGEKVLPDGVEEALRSHPLVADCRVTALPNALLGQVVAAEVVWLGIQRDAVAVKHLLHDHAAGSLPKCHLPAVVRLVDAIDTNRNLKRSRTPRP